MWPALGIAAYLALGTAIAYSLRDSIGMAVISPIISYPLVVLFWPIVLFIFMLGNL